MLAIPYTLSLNASGRVPMHTIDDVLRQRGFKTSVLIGDPFREIFARILLIQKGDLPLNKLQLFEHLANLEGKSVRCDFDPQRPFSDSFDLKRLLVAEVSFGDLIEQFGQFLGRQRGDLLGGRILQQELFGGHPEDVAEQFPIFRENLIQERNDLALEVAFRVDLPEPEATKLAQGQCVTIRDSRLLVLSQHQDFGDDLCVYAVILDLAHAHVAQGVGDDGVDDLDVETLLQEPGVKDEPVVSGCLHAHLGVLRGQGILIEHHLEFIDA